MIRIKIFGSGELKLKVCNDARAIRAHRRVRGVLVRRTACRLRQRRARRPTPATGLSARAQIGDIPYTPPTFAGGRQPTMDAAEIDDVGALLCTLTDGFDPNNPQAYPVWA
jgi:hypothetical protein